MIATGCGFLLNDNRNSGGTKHEADIVLCTHCQRVIELAKWRAADGGNGWCMQCMAPICGPCANNMLKPLDEGGGCLPFVKKIDMLLSQAHAKTQFRRVAGLEPEPAMFIGPGRT
jgi:hypothetical protein